ncbi:MAG TPA: discoidin domain-containing protein [Opitutaceae bacterium]|nr:discoidin domain-containing protein [Opitutaceae bacterium]
MLIEKANSIGVSPAEAVKQFELPPGYSLQVVLSEPEIAEPVMIAFDGNGRMYVAEMLTYMLDVDGKGEMEPRSRVSRHEDTDGDGVYDKHTIYADHLLLPRTLLTLDDRVIIGETNTLDLYCYRDTDGDGVADEKKLWFQGGPRGGNLEHQPNGLIWALDNGLYSTYNDYRLRFTDGRVSKESIPENQGQWGVTQDDFGKVWFVNAGLELGPVHFQQHILYGRFSIDGELGKDFTAVWPLGPTPDIQGGTFQLRADGTLSHFTATCGQDIFRGDRLPEDLRGDLLFAEPAGHLVRRAKVSVRDGVTHLENAYPGSEFIRTKDRLFRPVNMVTPPDGTLYIVDMYRGIVQESNWTREHSYLREQILKYDLAKEIGRGRIYRLVHKDFNPGPQPHMLNETTAQLVQHLSHPNGWWRDSAQKLIILRGDKSVAPQLRELAAHSPNLKARIQALWTLEGLDAITPALVGEALRDREIEIRKAGIRLSEPFIKPAASAGVLELLPAVKALLADPDPSVVIQAMASLKRAEIPDARELAKTTAEKSKFASVYAINEQLWVDTKEDPFLLPLLGAGGLKSYRDGRTFFNSLCFSCHGEDGKGTPSGPGRTIAPPLSHSPRLLESAQAAMDIVLHGLEGKVDGVDYGAPMVPMASYSDQQLADVLTYARNSFGNRGNAITAGDIAAARRQARPNFWTMPEIENKYPVLKIPRDRFMHRAEWKLSASHAADTLPGAIDDLPETAYLAPKSPFIGMWVIVELPEPSVVKTIVMDSAGTEKAYPNTYDVQLSDDGKTWTAPVASGHGETTTQIHIANPKRAKFVRINLVDKIGWTEWAISNLEFYGEEGKLR